MPFNGSGTFNPLPAPTYPAVVGDIIYAARFNSVINDLISGFSNTLTRDMQGKPSQAFDFNNFKGVNLVAGTATGHAVEFDQAVAAFAAKGRLTASGLTIAAARLAGRQTAGIGAFEEIAVQAPLSFAGGFLSVTPGIGTGTVIGPVSSVDSQVVLFDGAGGQNIKASAATGVAVVTAGVLSAITQPAGALVGTTDAQVLTNKTLTSPITNGGTSNTETLNTPAIAGGTAAALTSFGIRNAGSGAFDMLQAYNSALTASRTLTWNLNDAARSVSLSGNISLGGTLTTAGIVTFSGAFAGTFTLTGATNVTFPLTGTLATLAGAEALTNKALGAGTTLTTDVTGNDSALLRVMLKDSGYVFLDKGNSGTALQTLDYTAGSHQKITATGNHTIATSNWLPSGDLGELLLELTNGGAFTITWPTINWITGDGSTTTTFASNGVTLQSAGTDFAILWTRDGGTTIYGKFMR